MDRIELLKNLLIYVGENDKELIFKCPNHEDKNHKKNKGHFYVSKESFSYICFKCGIHGKNVFTFLIHNYYKLPNLNPNKLSFQQFVELFVKNNYLLTTNETKPSIKTTDNIYEDKRILFNTLIDKLFQITLKNKDLIFSYFKSIRKIEDKDFVCDLIRTKKILLFKPLPDIRELIKEIYNIELPSSIEPGLCINYNTFNHHISTMNLQIRVFSNKFRYFNLKIDNGTIIINNTNYNVPFYSVFIVEGPFDTIKLWYLLKKSNVDFNFIIHTLGGKNNTKSLNLLNEYINQMNYNINKYMVLLDNDTEYTEIINFVDKLQEIMNISSKEIYIRKFENKDIKDLDTIELNDFKNVISFVKYDLFKTGLYKLLSFINT